MIFIREGTHVHRLLSLLACTGEYPVQAVYLLGSERTWKALIQKLTKPQDFCLKESGKRHRCRMLTISGNGKYRTIRLHVSALVLLEQMDPDAYRYYMDHFDGHHFSGNQYHVERNHRVAEALVMCENAGIEPRPYRLPTPRNRNIRFREEPQEIFYLSRSLKNFWQGEMNKTKFSRIVGAILYGHSCYMVYNSRDTLMKWNGEGESKVQNLLSSVWSSGWPGFKIDSAILFGRDYLVAMRTLEEAARTRRFDKCFYSVYPHIHFIPMSGFGVKLLQIITTENWNRELLSMLYDEETLDFGRKSFEYDVLQNRKAYCSHLDGDLCRLIRMREALRNRSDIQYQITCYPEQLPMLQEFLSEFRGTGRVAFDTVDIEEVWEILFDPEAVG